MLRLRDRTPKRHGAREKKKTKKAILGDQRPRNFRLIGSHLNRGFEDLDSAFKVEKVESMALKLFRGSRIHQTLNPRLNRFQIKSSCPLVL
ncbi:MAG: hypothetical protein EBZ08_12035 [Betaproteobacteria bacterium]|nr:hypothetical protein [Betaproteobacteria bacterium]